jgi:hypothetical protein
VVKEFVGAAAGLSVAILFTFAVPRSLASDELSLTYTKPECSTTVRKGRTYGVYATTILWVNDGNRTAEDYATRNGMACKVGVIMCTLTECSLPLTTCYQYTAQWVRVGIVGKSPTQLNIVNPQCPAT